MILRFGRGNPFPTLKKEEDIWQQRVLDHGLPMIVIQLAGDSNLSGRDDKLIASIKKRSSAREGIGRSCACFVVLLNISTRADVPSC